MTDLPAPPLVENTVMTRAELAVAPSSSCRATDGAGADTTRLAAARWHGLGQLARLDRRLEDVLDAGAQRLAGAGRW